MEVSNLRKKRRESGSEKKKEKKRKVKKRVRRSPFLVLSAIMEILTILNLASFIMQKFVFYGEVTCGEVYVTHCLVATESATWICSMMGLGFNFGHLGFKSVHGIVRGSVISKKIAVSPELII